jgi:hypothetical protein
MTPVAPWGRGKDVVGTFAFLPPLDVVRPPFTTHKLRIADEQTDISLACTTTYRPRPLDP